MKISLDCNISLSKKLRSIVGENGSVTLLANGLTDGKGFCKLILESENSDMAITSFSEMPKEFRGETSIMITPITLTKDNPPNNSSTEVSSIFATAPQLGEKRTPISRLAAEFPPEQEEIPHSILVKEEIETPQTFKQIDNNDFKDFVLNLQELMAEVEKAKNKVADINLDSITDPRIRAVEMERKERMESIDKDAYIVNDQAGVLTVNDLGITLALNSPYNLSNLSARKIAASSDLKGLLKAGYVKFINPDQINSYIDKVENANGRGLQVFDNRKQAEANMGTTAIEDDNDAPTKLHDKSTANENSMEITEEDLNTPTEEEKMIMDLTRSIGKSSGKSSGRGSRYGNF